MRAIDLASSCSPAGGISVGQTAAIALIAAAVGAAAAIAAAFLTARWARSDALADRRKEAYQAYIASHDELYRTLNASGTIRIDDSHMSVRDAVGIPVGVTSSAFVAVLLVGSEPVTSLARRWQAQAWAAFEVFSPSAENRPTTAAEWYRRIEELLQQEKASAAEFLKLARGEVGAESGRRLFRRSRAELTSDTTAPPADASPRSEPDASSRPESEPPGHEAQPS